MTDARGLLNETRRELARFSTLLELLVGELDEATWRARPAPGEWAPVEIVCHLRDEETEDFGARLRVILEGGARFEPNDPERLAVARQYQQANPSEALAAFQARRMTSLDLLDSVAAGSLARDRRDAQRRTPLRPRPSGELGGPRPAAPAAARGHARAPVGRSVGAAPGRVRRADSVRSPTSALGRAPALLEHGPVGGLVEADEQRASLAKGGRAKIAGGAEEQAQQRGPVGLARASGRGGRPSRPWRRRARRRS